MALASLYWVFRLVEGNGPAFPPWAKALVVLLSLRPIMGDLIHGNVNLFILFLIAASLFAFGRRRDLGGGLLLGLAIACKLTPALFVPYFLWKRSWKMLIGCAAGLGLAGAFTKVLAGMLFGVSPWDAVTMAGVISLVIVVSIAASLLPAIRAARVEPMRVLRQE